MIGQSCIHSLPPTLSNSHPPPSTLTPQTLTPSNSHSPHPLKPPPPQRPNPNTTYLLLPTGPTSARCRRITWLHLQHSAEEALGGGCQETYLCIWMQAVQVGTLRWETLIKVCVIAFVFEVGGLGEARSIHKFAIQLDRERKV